MESKTTCQWCETEIIWDAEIGPERYCPHCDNELGGYRTLEVAGEAGDEDENEDEQEESFAWDEEDEENRGILRSTREIAANSVISQMLNEQFEMPECSSCREFMIEAGTQSVGDNSTFTAKHTPHTNEPIFKTPFKIIWFVCPSCYRTESYLNFEDRKSMLDALTPEE